MIGQYHEDTIRTMNNLAATYLGQEKFKEVDALYSPHVKKIQEMYGLSHHIVRDIMNKLDEAKRQVKKISVLV